MKHDPARLKERGIETLTLTLSRFILNTAFIIGYPFLPAIARELRISLQSAGALMGARSLVGLTSPIFGTISDRVGRRRMMLVGYGLLILGAGLLGSAPRLMVAFLAFALIGLAKTIFDPSLRAYLGDNIPYNRRGLIVAIIEFSWAGSILLGAPLIGLGMARFGWQTTTLSLAGCAVLGWAVLAWVLPHDRSHRSSIPARVSLSTSLNDVLKDRSSLGILATTWLVAGASELLLVVYGAWMESSYGLSVERVGLATITIGVSSLLAEILVGGVIDRVGKRLSVSIGILFTAISFTALPFLSHSLSSALVGLFIAFFFFEFSVVGLLSLATEIAPSARATMLSLDFTLDSLGRTAGDAAGPWLWALGGMNLNGMVAGAAMFAAFIVLRFFVHQE